MKQLFKKIISILLIVFLMTEFILADPLSIRASSGSWTGGTVDTGFHLKVTWSESAQDPITNTSKVTANVYLVQDAGYSLQISAGKSLTIKIGTASTTLTSTPGIYNSGGATTKLGSYSTTVTHGSTGSLSVPISATFGINATLSGTYFGSMSTSSTAVLDTLDRTAATMTTTITKVTATTISIKGTSSVACDSWYYSINGGTTWVAYGVAGTSNSVTISGLTANTSYGLRVKARKTSNHVTSYSSIVGKYTATLAPSGLTSTSTASSGKISWTAVTGATSYTLYKNGVVMATGVTATNYTFSGLTAGTAYTLGVAALNTGGSSGIASKTVTTLPANAPTGLTLSGVTSTGGTLNWNAVTGATTYEVFLNGVSVKSGLTATSYTYTGLTAGTAYTVAVRGTNSGGSTASSSTTITPIPEVPGTLTTTGITEKTATLSWGAAKGAVSYNVYINDQLKASGITTTSYAFTGLTGNTSYKLSVCAVNAGGVTTKKDATIVTTPTTTVTITTVSGETYATISWAAVPGATSYVVYNGSTKVVSGLTTTSYKITQLTPGTTYTYGVAGVSASGTGTVKNVTFTTLANAAGMYVKTATQTTLALSWSGATGATSYNVYLNGEVYSTGVKSTTCLITDLEPGVEYSLGLTAINASGESTMELLVADTQEAVLTPTGLAILDQTATEVTLAWDEQPGVSKYRIYKDGILIGDSTNGSYIDNTYDNTACTYMVSAVDLDGLESETSLQAESLDLVAPIVTKADIDYNVMSADVETGFSDDRSGMDSMSFKWAYGEQEAGYFAENGNPFDGTEFTVLQSGVYTVYVSDNAGNIGIKIINVEDIYFTTVSGGYTFSSTDLSVDSQGIDMEFSRNYDSTNTESGPFGQGWSFGYYGKLEILTTPKDVVKITLPGGYKEYFSYSEEAYTGINTRNVLKSTSDGYLLTSDSMSYTFDKNGYLTGISDQNKNTITIAVNSSGYPTEIIDTVGRSYLLAYTDGQITSITDPAGRVVTYHYTDGNLSQTYSCTGELLEQYFYTNGLLTETKDAYGVSSGALTYDEAGRIKTLTNGTDITNYTYSFDGSGNQVVSDNTNTVSYNGYGDLILDSDGMTYSYLNIYGDLASTTSDGTVTSYQYDSFGNVLSQTTFDGTDLTQKIQYSYVYFGATSHINICMVTTENHSYDDQKVDTITNSTETTTYDAYGNVLTSQTVDAESDTTTASTYDINGNLKTQTDDKGNVTTYSYDGYGYTTHVAVTDSEKNESSASYDYNNIGFRTMESSGGTSSTGYIYDQLGNILKTTITVAEKGVRITRYVYNAKGQLLQKISPAEYDSAADGLVYDENKIGTTNTYSNSEAGVRYTYDEITGMLAETVVGSYDITSDADGNVTEVSVEGNSLASYVYTSDENSLLSQITYGNGAVLSYEYNGEGDITTIKVNDVPKFTYTYSETTTENSETGTETTIDTTISKNIDAATETVYVTEDDDNVTVTTYTLDGNGLRLGVTDTYSLTNNSSVFTETVNGATYGRSYNSDNFTDTFQSEATSVYVKTYTEDSNGVVTEDKITQGTETLLTTDYKKNSNGDTESVSNTTKEGTETLSYTYDAYGNIETISQGESELYHYYYDSSDELIRTDDAVLNETLVYTYDTHGNILVKATYAYTKDVIDGAVPTDIKSYAYENGEFPDELTSYDGQTITYDGLGNPLTYLGWTMTWSAGRQLATMSNGSTSISYAYNASGIRTSKTVNGVTTTYTTVDGTITSQNDGTNELYFRYDKNNSLTGFSLNGTEYLYVKNVHGDITGILDMTGTMVVSYIYDSWGKVESIKGTLAETVGKINPMRYRGYYQDEETGFYYLQSRYYDSNTCRFLNADEYGFIDMSSPVGANLFAYCNNNTVNMVDADGCRPRYIEAGTHRMWSRILAKNPKYFNTFYGSARKYKSIIGGLTTPTCYAFAIGYSSAINPGAKSGSFPALMMSKLLQMP